MRRIAALVGVLAWLGLLNYQAAALAVAVVALVVATLALLRSGIRDAEVAAWKADVADRAQAQQEALESDLRED